MSRGISPSAHDKFVKLPVRAPEVKTRVEASLTPTSLPEREPLPATKPCIVQPHDRIWVDDIRRAVCKHFHITKTEILSRRRNRQVVRSRQVFIYLARSLTTLSF